MLKIKNILLWLALSLGLMSCSEYSKVLNKGNSVEQYELATKLFEAGKFNKALQLFEKIMPDFQGKPQMERIQFMVAQSNFGTKNYLMSAYHFERFTKNYPRSTKKEEASYLSAYSYYLSTPRSSLDQKETYTAIEAFQNFINKYPDSDKIADANKYIKEMQLKLEKKQFDIAYQYYHTYQYKAAVVAFDNFLSDNLGTSYKEDALFYKSKAAHDLALNSIDEKKEVRIKEALQAIERLERNFKESKYKDDVAKMKVRLTDELNAITSITKQ
jgi:outer membrane protein assembly factor BamD